MKIRAVRNTLHANGEFLIRKGQQYELLLATFLDGKISSYTVIAADGEIRPYLPLFFAPPRIIPRDLVMEKYSRIPYSGEWFDVRDELPERTTHDGFVLMTSRRVLVASTDEPVQVGGYIHPLRPEDHAEEIGDYWIDESGHEITGVTHWTDLPTPPSQP